MEKETSGRSPRTPQAEPAPAPTDAELSRIAREAVHQPADPRLEAQLARMGLTDAVVPPRAGPTPVRGRSLATDPEAAVPAPDLGPEVERLGVALRRIERIMWALVGISAVLAVAVVVLLLR